MSAGSEIPPEEICMPCRGTGRLSSSLGGEPHEVQCPWCHGTGRRIAGIDAQQAPAESGAPPAGEADAPTAPGAPAAPDARGSAAPSAPEN
jgi:hypothetical protein